MIEVLARRAAGLLLVALTAVVPIAAYPSLDAWDAELAGRANPSSEGLLELLAGGIGIWLIIGTGLWWHWRRTTMWPVWARWAAFPGLFLSVFTCLFIAGKRGAPVALVVGAGLLVACWLLSEVVRLVLTRPVTNGLVASKLEIPLPLRGLAGRLCVRDDRLVLDGLVSRWKRSRDVVALPWRTIRSIELVELDQDMVCQVLVYTGRPQARSREFDVTPGPALHVIGTAREVLIPVTAEVGRVALDAVRARSAGAGLDDEITADRWDWKSSARKSNPRTDHRPYLMIPVTGFLLTPLLALIGTTTAVVTGSKKLQEQLHVVNGVVDPMVLALLGIGSVVFLFLLSQFVMKPFFRFMEAQNFIEAFPEPPPPPPKTGTVPGSGKKRKNR